MALYTILFGFSIFLIAVVLAIIKKMFFYWKREHKIETMKMPAVQRPAINVIIYADKCVLRKKTYAEVIYVYDILDKSDIALNKMETTSDGMNQSSNIT